MHLATALFILLKYLYDLMAINECDMFLVKMSLECYDNDHVLLLVQLTGTNVH